MLSRPSYREFLYNEMPGDIGAVDISIDVSFGRVHEIRKLRDCFESGQSWSLLREGDNYILKFRIGESEKPYMTALISNDISTVELFVSNDFVNDKGQTLNSVHYPLDQILLMHYLVSHEGVIVHSAGMSFNGNGYIFPGCSGTGKSTVSKSLVSSDKVLLFSDDRIIARKESETYMIYGTPWPGEAGIAVNKSAPLKGVFFLEKSGDNFIQPIEEAEAFRRFMPVLSVPWYDGDSISDALSLVSELISRVPSYVLHFKPGPEVVDTIEKFVSA